MYDLVIVGGGVWGCAAALAALEQGCGRVLLLEASPVLAGESSGKSGGIMSEFAGHPDDRVWVARSRALFEAAAQASGDAGMVRRYGRLVVAGTAEAPAFRRVADELAAEGMVSEMLSPEQVRARFPLVDGLATDTFGLWTPGAWHLNATGYAQTIVSAARARGLEVRLRHRVHAVRIADDRIRLEGPAGPDGTHATVEGARVLIAAGTWTRKLLQTAGIDIPYRPYRVQLSSIAFAAAESLPIISETATDMYITPDGPGSLLVGDGTQLWEHDPDAYEQAGDPAFEAEIAAGLARLVSSAGDSAHLRRSWAGLCGATPDRRPLLGPVAERLYIACGDNGSGVGRGPALGELAARVAMGVEPAPARLDPFRFPSADFRLRPGSGFLVPD
jgi:sarcosine oxidase subunit beta